MTPDPRDGSMAGWRTIDSAPKDGTRVLLCGDPKRYGEPVWIDWWYSFTNNWAGAGYHNPPASLVGWQPLPAPPKVE